jgi:predicted phosphoribosyltransferase
VAPSITEKGIGRSSVPVLVVRADADALPGAAGAPDRLFERVLVAHDGSRSASRAIETLALLVEPERVALTLFGVIPAWPVAEILADDGLATGSTLRAAVAALRRESPARILAAVPVSPAGTCEEMRAFADAVMCVETPEPFRAVGAWYEDFGQTTDDEVRDLLARAAETRAKP